MVRKLFIIALLASFCVGVAEDEAPSPQRIANKKNVDKTYQARRKQHAGSQDVLVRPGLIAFRKDKRVEIQGEATGVGERETVEFFVIGEKSGHDYEALAYSFASPGDVREALVFIGMTPGRTVDFDKLMFWPKGERVQMTLNDVRVESLVLNTGTGKPLDKTGLVFTGGRMVTTTNIPPRTAFAGDLRSPFSVAANYNEMDSVLDVPRAAPQGEMYELQAVNPAHLMPEFTPVSMVLEPEYKDGTRRVTDVTLEVAIKPGIEPKDVTSREAKDVLPQLVFQVKDTKGKALNTEPDINGALKAFVALVEKGRDPFVQVRFSDSTPLAGAHHTARILASIENERGIRVEPPESGGLYYKAFIPAERDRKREGRMMQPWELHLRVVDGKVTAVLSDIREIWEGRSLKPELVVTDHNIPTPADLRDHLDAALRKEFKEAIVPLPDVAARKKLLARLAEISDDVLWGPAGETLRVSIFDAYDNHFPAHKVYKLRAILVYAPQTLTRGQLIAFLKPVLATHPHIHVFLDN